MATALKEADPVCFDIRGKDAETALVGPITSQIIDADRLVRFDFKNGMPGWMMYRTALAGDSLYLPALKEWTIAFTWAYAVTGGVRRTAITEELIGCAALDALSLLIYAHPLAGYKQTAADIGTNHKTYWRLREAIYRRMQAGLGEYWLRLVIAYQQVRFVERKMTIKR